jgi:predicted nucleotidyltransferase
VEQNLTNEIILILQKGDLHPRAIAQGLGTNHMTVTRKLRELAEENCVDRRTEGKNTVYFLKKSIEAKNAVMTAEIYKQSRVLAQYPVLRGIFSTIQAREDIPLALLFGSYAKGTATKESDIDIYIETLNPNNKKDLEQRNSSISIKIGEFDIHDLLVREILKDHVIIRGVERYYDKTGIPA